jgi:predicted nucleic acid-binding protein
MIMLDTNVVVAFLNGDKSILKRIRDEIDRIAMSSFVFAAFGKSIFKSAPSDDIVFKTDNYGLNKL